MSTMNPVVHFELPAKDTTRMVKFYEHAFGWKTKDMGKDMGGYVVVTTTETGEDGRPRNPGAINGGFYLSTADPMSQHPGIVIAVDDLETSMRQVKAAGGTFHGEPQDIPGVGRFVSVIDTEGNRVSMLQPKRPSSA